MKALYLIVLLLAYIYSAPEDSQSQKEMNNIEELRVENSPVFAKPPLFYYKRFLRNHSKVNPKVPIKKHYSNERRLRVEKDNLLTQIEEITRKKQFQKRDTEHDVLKKENTLAKLK